jgi:hypothetical protein
MRGYPSKSYYAIHPQPRRLFSWKSDKGKKKKMKCKPVEIEVKDDHGIILNRHHYIGILLLLYMITDILNDISFRAFVCSRISDVWFLPLG